MNISDFLRDKGSPPSPTDEILYEFVATELSNSIFKQGLWTKSLSDCDWDEKKAKALYVKMRILQLRKSLIDEVTKQNELRLQSFGLTGEDIKYLINPIKETQYLNKYNISKDKLHNAIQQDGFPAVIIMGILWVKDSKL